MFDQRPTILFDWDGTLLDSGPATTSAWRSVLQESQCPAPDHVVRTLFRDGWPLSYLRVSAFGQLPPQDVVLAQLAEARRQMPPAQLFGDAGETLPRLRGLGVRIALVTNTTAERLIAEMTATSIDTSLFDFAVTADLVARPKPAPDPYIAALLVLPPGTAVIAIEDSAVGVNSATAAGVKVFEISRSGVQDTDAEVLNVLNPNQLARLAGNHHRMW